jgi:hypothetical protein
MSRKTPRNAGAKFRLEENLEKRSQKAPRTMIIIRVDFHPEFQQIAFVDTDTGELECLGSA